MNITKKLERAAGTLLSVNQRTDFDLEPVCKLLKEAHDYIVVLETTQSSNAEKLRQAFSDYVRSEGCSCCRDEVTHAAAAADRLGELLGFTPYPDGSGYDFYAVPSTPKPPTKHKDRRSENW